MGYTARTDAPSKSNKYYRHTLAGGLNECILISNGSCLPNCVGYAWGRFYEVSGKKPKLSKGNAENWYGYNDGYERGKTPKLGAVICWSKGKVGVSSDGAGHVGVVEKIYSDGSILVSQSGYGGSRFFTTKIAKPYEKTGYKFQGFIYNPAVKESRSEAEYVKGKDYTLQANVKVRAGAGIKYKQKTVNELSKNGKKYATSKNSKDPAVLKKGTVVTVQEVIKSGKDIWLKIPSGYIAAKYNEEVYVS